MPLVKKVKKDWYPAENPALKVGETIEVSDARQLLREKKVELAKEPKKPAAKKPAAKKK